MIESLFPLNGFASVTGQTRNQLAKVQVFHYIVECRWRNAEVENGECDECSTTAIRQLSSDDFIFLSFHPLIRSNVKTFEFKVF